MKLLDTFRLNIAEYFDSLVNQIDINVEKLVLNQHLSDELSLDQKNDLHSIRNIYMNEINKIKNFYLQNPLQLKNLTENEIINENSLKLNYEFCLLIDLNLFNYYNEKLNKVGVLVVTDFYLSQTMISKIL